MNQRLWKKYSIQLFTVTYFNNIGDGELARQLGGGGNDRPSQDSRAGATCRQSEVHAGVTGKLKLLRLKV